MSEEFKKTIDFIVTLGGDGTILWASKQFSGEFVPPMITFDQGSLGFLCNFVFEDHKEVLSNIFMRLKCPESDPNCDNVLGADCRRRLRVTMGEESLNKDRLVFRGDNLTKSELLHLDGFHVLNEVVIDRGPSPYSIQLDIYLDDNKLTSIVGDGIIISTPTGSTAYNLSGGGSIVQPNTPCILLTPIAPHSLSFRPLILHESSVIKLKKTEDNRSGAWVSLDGATRF